MNAVFKLAATAVMALAIIWLLVNYVFPLAGGGGQVRQAMMKALEAAQGLDDQVLVKALAIRKGENLPAESLDTSTRSVNYRCTDTKQCCPLGGITSGCRLALDERLLSAQEDSALPAHYRCQLEENIYLCTAYFGRGPAQLEWGDLRAPREIELGKDLPTVVLKIRNTGQTKAYDVVATAKIYKVSLDGDRETTALHSGPINRQTEEILPGGEASFTLPLEIREAGTYQVALTVRGVESGKVTKTLELKARGLSAAMAACKAGQPGEARLEDGQCLREYRCEGCAYDYECKLAWEGKLGEEVVDWSRDAVWAPTPPENCT